jgi:hypothetical protein
MAREVSQGGRTLYLPEKEEWVELAAEPRSGPYAIAVEFSGYVTHELRCSVCGETWKAGQLRERYHYAPAPGGWRKCGEWR